MIGGLDVSSEWSNDKDRFETVWLIKELEMLAGKNKIIECIFKDTQV